MGLTPRRDIPKKKFGWEKLESMLKLFIDNDPRIDSSFGIKLSEFSMSESEIESELTKNGYHFEKSGDILKIF